MPYPLVDSSIPRLPYWLQHWELESFYWEESVQCQSHSPLNQVFHILCQVCSNRRQHLVTYIVISFHAVAGKVKAAQIALLIEDAQTIILIILCLTTYP